MLIKLTNRHGKKFLLSLTVIKEVEEITEHSRKINSVPFCNSVIRTHNNDVSYFVTETIDEIHAISNNIRYKVEEELNDSDIPDYIRTVSEES